MLSACEVIGQPVFLLIKKPRSLLPEECSDLEMTPKTAIEVH